MVLGLLSVSKTLGKSSSRGCLLITKTFFSVKFFELYCYDHEVILVWIRSLEIRIHERDG